VFSEIFIVKVRTKIALTFMHYEQNHCYFRIFQITANIMIPRIVEIHVGERTHSHDQFITLQSFKTIKAICNALTKPRPPLALLPELDLSA
jgi:hypothetical protein